MNSCALANLLRLENCEIVNLDEQWVKVGGYGNFFYAYCIFDGDLYSLHDRHFILPRYEFKSASYNDSQIILTRYRMGEAGIEPIESFPLCVGWDPRVVSNGVNAYAIIISNPSVTGHHMLLYDFRRQKLLPIGIPSGLRYGKNWQPYLQTDQLFVVHELTPFRVFRLDVNTGQAEIVREIELDLNMPSLSSDRYTMLRGGSNALSQNGVIQGFGRATAQPFRHHPFIWSLDESDNLELLFTGFFSPLFQRGYNIIDPTSLFFIGEDLYLGLACSELDWAHSQLLTHFLIALRATGPKSPQKSLAEFYRKRSKTQISGRPTLDRHIFFCIEMPSAIPNKSEWGGRASVGIPGHLVHGPYLQIAEEGKYVAELSYLTRACPATRAGEFDVTVSTLDENNNQTDFSALGRVDLTATNGSMGEARVEFDTASLSGRLLEMRVYVEARVEMNAYHIRTRRHEEG